MKNGQQVAQLAIAWKTDELLSPEQRLLLAEQTYGYTVVHEFEYAGEQLDSKPALTLTSGWLPLQQDDVHPSFAVCPDRHFDMCFVFLS